MYDAAEREMDLYRNEISRITAERDQLRRLNSEILRSFEETGRSHWQARVGSRVLNAWHNRNGASTGYGPTADAIRAEADADNAKDKLIADLREKLDEIGVLAVNAPEDGDSFGLLEEIAMRIAAVDTGQTQEAP